MSALLSAWRPGYALGSSRGKGHSLSERRASPGWVSSSSSVWLAKAHSQRGYPLGPACRYLLLCILYSSTPLSEESSCPGQWGAFGGSHCMFSYLRPLLSSKRLCFHLLILANSHLEFPQPLFLSELSCMRRFFFPHTGLLRVEQNWWNWSTSEIPLAWLKMAVCMLCHICSLYFPDHPRREASPASSL